MAAVGKLSPYSAAAAAASGGDFLWIVEENLRQENYRNAWTDLKGILHSSDEYNSPENLSRIYTALTTLFPRLGSRQFSELASNLRNLPNCHLSKEQYDLCIVLGNGYKNHAMQLSLQKRIYEYHTAMHHYSVAWQIAKEHLSDVEKKKAHQKASSLFSTLIQEQLMETNRLKELGNGASRSGDSNQMDEIFSRLGAMHRFISSDESQCLFQGMYRTLMEELTGGPPRQEFQKFLSQIRFYLTDLPLCEKPVTQKYREALDAYREHFQRASPQDLRDFAQTKTRQQVALGEFRNFFSLLLNDALLLLGPEPCAYEIRFKGSFGRGLPCPFSDLEWFLVIEEETHKDYFVRLAQILEMQIISLGETEHSPDPPQGCVDRVIGLYSDPKPSEPHPDPLIGEAASIAVGIKNPTESSRDLMHSQVVHAHGDTIQGVFDAAIAQILDEPSRRQFAEGNINLHIASFQTKWTCSFGLMTSYNMKEDFARFLFYFLPDIGLYFDIRTSNIFDLVDELSTKDFFTKESARLIKQALSSIYLIRLRLHQTPRNRETASLEAAGSGALMQDEKKALGEAYWLVLRPLYQILGEQGIKARNIDLGAEAFRELNSSSLEQCETTIRHYIESGCIQDVQDFAPYYFLIEEGSKRRLLINVLRKVDGRIPDFARVPGPDGWSYAMEENQLYLKDALDHMLTGTDGIKVFLPGDDVPKYFDTTVAKQILGGNGELQKVETDCKHRVAFATKGTFSLHFKQRPNTPLFEYAAHNLSQRIGGNMTPSSLLLRFETGDKTYPVLVTRTIQGRTLKQAPSAPIDPVSLTKLLLLSILTRPGDGRESNYVVDDEGKIACVDNDVSFVEPIQEGRLWGKRVHFSSVLFCMGDQPLDKGVLQAFTTLKPEQILHSWLEDLFAQEKAYTALFPEETRLEHFDDGNDDHFTPKFPVIKGTLATLYMQFLHLQQFLKQRKCQVKTLELLEALMTLQSGTDQQIIGGHVARSYRETAAGKPPAERLAAIVDGATAGQSISSTNALRATFGTVPKAEDLEKKEYSLEEAKKELNLLIATHFLEGGLVVSREGKTTITASFKEIDPDRHQAVLDALIFLLKDSRFGKPEKVVLTDCQLKPRAFDHFFSDQLQVLDLKGVGDPSDSFIAAILKRISIKNIATKCPRLKRLYLNRSGLEFIWQLDSYSYKPLHFRELEELHVSNCAELSFITINAPNLRILIAKDCPKLEEVSVDAPMCTLNIDGSPVTKVQTHRFGKANWEVYFGKIGEEPPVPERLLAQLDRPCPIYPARKVKDTHFLVLIPTEVNGNPLTLTNLRSLVQKPRNGYPTKLCFLHLVGEYKEQPIPEARWVLMTKEVLPLSQSKYKSDYPAFYEKRIENLRRRGGAFYQIPPVLDAAVCILTHYVATGVRLFHDTRTACRERGKGTHFQVGDFSSKGLSSNLHLDCFNDGTTGVAAYQV